MPKRGNADRRIIPRHTFTTFKIGRFRGTSPTDLVNQDVIEGNLFTMFDQIISTLRSKYLLSPISYQGMVRVETLEAWGRGTITIINETERCGLAKPTFNVRQGGLEVIFERNPMLFSENGVGDGVNATINGTKDPVNGADATINGDKDTVNDDKDTVKDTVNGGRDTVKDTVNVSLTENQRLILEMISQNQHTTSEEISKNVGVNLRNTKKNLAALKANGLIERVGADKNGYWRVLK